MTSTELKEIVEERMDDPFVLGRLACNLRRNEIVEQRHNDDRKFTVFWRDTGSFWRCTVFLGDETDLCLIQVDLYSDQTVRIEAFEPCGVTISPPDGILCLTRYKPLTM